MFIKRTKCLPGWPVVYRTYHQETEPPYRHAARCVVVRLWRVGLVLGIWTGAHHDEDAAHAAALGARPVAVLDDEGDLLQRFRRRDTERTP